MKNIFLSLLFLSLVLYGFCQNKIDVLHYKYSIELNDYNDTITGTALIRFVVNINAPTVSFDLTNNKISGTGMIVSTASFPFHNALPPRIEQYKDKLTLTPMRGFTKGDTSDVIINYKGVPADGLIISKNKYGNRTFFADNWPNRAHNWIPCVDDPADKATVEFIVTAPFYFPVNWFLPAECRLK